VIVGHEGVNRMIRAVARDLEPAAAVGLQQRNCEIVEIRLCSGSERIPTIITPQTGLGIRRRGAMPWEFAS